MLNQIDSFFQGIVNMKCPACAMAELVSDTRDLPYTYKHESTIIPDVEGDFCSACGEVVLSAKESARVSAAMLKFNKQINAAIIDRKSYRSSMTHWD